MNTFGTLVLVDVFDLEVWKIRSLLLASSFVNLVLTPYLGHLIDRFGERAMVSLSYVFLVLCCVGFAAIHTPWLLAALLIVLKLLVTMEMGLSTHVYRVAPAEELPPTLSAGISINHITSVAMPLVAGAALPQVG